MRPVELVGNATRAEYEQALRNAEVQATIWWRRMKGYLPPCLGLEDLQQAARLGVWIATQRHDRTRGTQFVTTARWCALSQIDSEFRRLHHLPAHVIDRARKEGTLWDEHYNSVPSSLDFTLTEEADATRLVEVLEDPDTDVEYRALTLVQADRARSALRGLNENAATLIWRYVAKGELLKDVAADLGIHQQSAVRCVKNGLKQLRERLEAEQEVA